MELLVVVAVIALLIAVLLPALNKAKATAQRVKCMSILRQFGMADQIYAGDQAGWLVPVRMYVGEVIPSVWFSNNHYRELLGLPAVNHANINAYYATPAGLICPVSPRLLSPHPTTKQYYMYGSYGFNYTTLETISTLWIAPPAGTTTAHGFREPQVRSPANKMFLCDSTNWLEIAGAGSYTFLEEFGGLGPYGEFPTAEVYFAGIAYRHLEGVNIAYYDSHVAGLGLAQVKTTMYNPANPWGGGSLYNVRD